MCVKTKKKKKKNKPGAWLFAQAMKKDQTGTVSAAELHELLYNCNIVLVEADFAAVWVSLCQGSDRLRLRDCESPREKKWRRKRERSEKGLSCSLWACKNTPSPSRV